MEPSLCCPGLLQPATWSSSCRHCIAVRLAGVRAAVPSSVTEVRAGTPSLHAPSIGDPWGGPHCPSLLLPSQAHAASAYTHPSHDHAFVHARVC